MRNETQLIDDFADERPTRTGRTGLSGWSDSPITVALVVGGILAVVGISLAVIAPLVSASPSAQAMPPGAAGGVAATASAAPGASPTATGPSLQSSPNPLPSATATGRFRADQLESDVIKLVNQARHDARCKDVHNNSKLHTIARGHSTDMAANSYVGSTGSDGSSYADRAQKAKYDKPLGENVAHGPTSAAAVVTQWLGNGSSRGRILDCSATNIGVGVAQAPDGSYYWTQDFGR